MVFTPESPVRSQGALRKAPKGPSGPRKQGEGVEEEEQEVVGIERMGNGGVQARDNSSFKKIFRGRPPALQISF